MTKKEIIEAMGIHDANEITALLKLTKAELELKYADTFIDYTVENTEAIVDTDKEENIMKTNKIDGFEVIAQTQATAFKEKVIVVEAPKATEFKKVEYVKLHSTAKEICMKKYGMQREMLDKEEYKAFSDFINNEVCKKANYGIIVLYKTLMSITNKGKWALVTVQKKGSKTQYNCLFWYEKKEESGKVVQKLGDNVKYVTK